MRVVAAVLDARLVATAALLDAGLGRAQIELYDIARPPVLGVEPGGPPCAVIELQKPCGVVDEGYLVLAPYAVEGAMIDSNSSDTGVTWALIRSAEGVIVIDGTVTDSAGAGDFQVTGSSGTRLFAGGYVLLHDYRLV